MIIQIDKPTKNVNSFIFQNETGFSLYEENNSFFLCGEASEAELLSAYEAHNPPAPKEPTVADKLASVGLNLDDLKQALGLA